MQPNGNVPGAGRPVAGAPMNNVNAKPAPASTPAPKPVEPAFGNGGSVIEGKGGKKTGWILAVVFLLIVAAGGVGFGVWAMMDGNAQKDALNEQISALKQQNSELQDKSDSSDTNNDTDTDGDEINTADYIYVGEWGIKIKIPDSLSTVSYRFSNEAGFTKVTVWGVDCSGGRCQYFPDFADVSKNTSGMGSITRYPKGTEFDGGSAPELIFSDESYDYYLYRPQVAYTVENPSDESKWEMNGINIIGDMLSDSENYSKI